MDLPSGNQRWLEHIGKPQVYINGKVPQTEVLLKAIPKPTVKLLDGKPQGE